MPKTSGSFKKGHKGVKPKGAINRTTKEGKELLDKILMNQLDNANDAFNALKSDPSKFIDAYAKLLGYVLPKKTDITSDGEKIMPVMPTVIIKTKNGSRN